jgi:hypothetical protein
VKLLLARPKCLQRLSRVKREQLARFGQRAAPPVSLNEPLPGGSFECAQVLARGRLSDPDRTSGGRDAALPANLDQ